ncbi:MAG: hypothetical protein MI802_12955 [Desulfobacterales bacterium]|nr:hypothetical protein [Desulfobacterales bacterium]
MGNCKKHPTRQTPYRCAKYEIYQCRECLRCKDPKLYCKHRPSCAIYMITERGLDPDA